MSSNSTESSTLTPIKILVKSVYSPTQSHEFHVHLNMTVSDLKRVIESTFSGKPAVNSQKLIFGGKICVDDVTLGTYLNQNLIHVPSVNENDIRNGDSDEACVAVFHMLASDSVKQFSQSNREQTASLTEPSNAESQETSQAEINQRQIPSTSTPAAGAAPATPAATTAIPLRPDQIESIQQQSQLLQQALSLQQQAMLMMQIQYLEQMKLYHQSVSAMGGDYAAFMSQLQTRTGGISPPQPRHPIPAAPPMAPNANPLFFNHANAPMQGQGPRMQPLNQSTRIWQRLRHAISMIDFRLAFKMAFLLFIVGQDTPRERVLILASLLVIVYMHTTGILAGIYRLIVHHQGQNNAEANEASSTPSNPTTPSNQILTSITSVSRYVQISQQRGFFLDIWCFFMGFVCSIVPSWSPTLLQADDHAAQAPRAPPMPM